MKKHYILVNSKDKALSMFAPNGQKKLHFSNFENYYIFASLETTKDYIEYIKEYVKNPDINIKTH